MKKIILCLFLIVGISCIAPAHVSAATERIQKFDSKVTITKDNEARITETIVYDFGTNERHGIYRDIPIDYRDGETTFFIAADFNEAVDENNQSVQSETDEVDGNLRVRLGDEDVMVTGVKTYKLSYTLSPVVMKKDGKPFLNLDVLGEGWEVPVDNFSASVSLEGGAQLSEITWFGATSQNSTVTAQNIRPYSAVTINAFLPDGYVATFLEPNTPRPFNIGKFIIPFLIIGTITIGVVLTIIILTWRWWIAHRKRTSQLIITEYNAPKGMTPAEVGHLDDDASETREVTATVIDWAVRGYLKITRTETKGWFGAVDYTLTQLKSGKDLSDTERPLYDAFFAKGKEVKLKELDKSKMAAAVSKFGSMTKENLSKQGFYDTKGQLISRGTLTDAGARQWAKVEGFQTYLKVAEKDRLKFSDAPDKTPERFNALLPYAVALGVEKEWAKQFEGIDVTAETTWYAGNIAAFSAVNVATDIGTSFASTVSSNASVSASGGSAGSGAGGGGGGSW